MGSEKIEQCMVSGFRTAGIYPLNKQEVLKKIPGGVQSDEDGISDTITKTIEGILHPLRYNKSPKQNLKRKRLRVEPGKSVAASDSPDEEEDEENLLDASERLAGAGVPAVENLPSEVAKKRRREKENDEGIEETQKAEEHIQKISASDCQVSDFVVVIYNGHWWIGRVEAVGMDEDSEEAELKVNLMHPHGPVIVQVASEGGYLFCPGVLFFGTSQVPPCASGKAFENFWHLS